MTTFGYNLQPLTNRLVMRKVDGGTRTHGRLDHNQAPPVCRVLRRMASEDEVLDRVRAEIARRRTPRPLSRTPQNPVGRDDLPCLYLGAGR